MKKRLYKIQLSKFKNKGESQIYFHQECIADQIFFFEIIEFLQLNETTFLITLDDFSKVVLHEKDYIYFKKKKRSINQR